MCVNYTAWKGHFSILPLFCNIIALAYSPPLSTAHSSYHNLLLYLNDHQPARKLWTLVRRRGLNCISFMKICPINFPRTATRQSEYWGAFTFDGLSCLDESRVRWWQSESNEECFIFTAMGALKITKRIIKPDVYSKRRLLLFRDQTTSGLTSIILPYVLRSLAEFCCSVYDRYWTFTFSFCWNDTQTRGEEKKYVSKIEREKEKLYRDVFHSARCDAEIFGEFHEFWRAEGRGDTLRWGLSESVNQERWKRYDRTDSCGKLIWRCFRSNLERFYDEFNSGFNE